MFQNPNQNISISFTAQAYTKTASLTRIMLFESLYISNVHVCVCVCVCVFIFVCVQMGEYLYSVNGQVALNATHTDAARIILMGPSTASLVTFKDTTIDE